MLNKSLIIFVFLIGLIALSQTSCERLTDANQQDDGVPPAVPIGVQISYASDGEILIEWISNTEVDLKGYNIFRKTDSTDYQFIGFTTRSYWIDDSLNYDEKYYYKISAIDIWGEESEKSAEVFDTPINRYNPQKLRYISINARNWEGKISINLTWDPNKESDVAGYNIYRSLNSAFSFDSTTLVGFTTGIQFDDTANIELYKNYYYRIRVKDKGGLMSDESILLTDQVYGIAEQIFPSNDTIVDYFSFFKIKALKVPTNYQILVQINEYFGEIWSSNFSSNQIEDTIEVKFNPPYLYPYVYYYWRVITFSNANSEPNSISPLYKFKVKN